MTPNEAAERLGVDAKRVRRWLRQAGKTSTDAHACAGYWVGPENASHEMFACQFTKVPVGLSFQAHT